MPELDGDTLTAAIEAAVRAEYEQNNPDLLGLWPWDALPEDEQQVRRRRSRGIAAAVTAAAPIIAAAAVAATREAIADKITERREPYITDAAGENFYERGIAYGLDAARIIACSFSPEATND